MDYELFKLLFHLKFDMQVMRLNRFITDNEKYQSGIGECNAGIKTVSFPSMAFFFLTL